MWGSPELARTPFRAPMRLYGRLGALANDAGWDGADFAPTDQQREVHGILTERFETARGEYRQLMDEQPPALLAVAGRCESGGWLIALGPDGGRALPFRDS